MKLITYAKRLIQKDINK